MKKILIPLSILLFFGCFTNRERITNAYHLDNELLDTLVVRANRITSITGYTTRPYNETEKRAHDLIHTDLEIELDWERRAVHGVARLIVKPYFYPTDTLVLDAVNFEISKVTLLNDEKPVSLKYNNNGYQLVVYLDQTYQRNDTFTVQIGYSAFPEIDAMEQAYAIGSDQGLFFIDPDRNDPSKPTQVWTQGETEYNSRWFPTIDQPNERCTQELKITVEDSLVTLSNGLLVDQIKNMDGTRTDHWKLDLPHAPYLFALVVGEYAVLKEYWNDLELGYYVFPEYHNSAQNIFNHTPEMLTFFSDLTGVDYPWPKYSQVIVSDFVSGAMENTTSVIFAEGFQKTNEELVDFPNDMIVAHELSHHWFGNLVTCESWANITLNEGFANYAEYLWSDHKYGKAAAGFYNYRELNQYLMSARYQTRPLVYFGYNNKDAMFDAHSYNKGSLILHMLRSFLGDDAFFKGIQHYLEENAFDAVEAHDLRIAFEDISGKDLNWFFNQWFFDKGHPVLEIEHSYIDSLDELNIRVDQVQDSSNHRLVFTFPLNIELHFSEGRKKDLEVWVKDRTSSFSIKTKEEPIVVIFNSDHDLLCEMEVDYSHEDYANIFRYADHAVSQYTALERIKYHDEFSELFSDALDHQLHHIRILGLQNIQAPYSSETIIKVSDMALNDPVSLVRSRAFRFLSAINSMEEDLVLKMLERDSSAMVLSYCLDWLNKQDHPRIIEFAEKWENSLARGIEASISNIYQKRGQEEHLAYFEKRLFKKSPYRNSVLINSYSKLLSRQKPELIYEKSILLIDQLEKMGMDSFQKQFYLRIIEEQIENLTEIAQRIKNDPENSKRINKYIEKLGKALKN